MRMNLALWVLAPALLHMTGCDIEDFAGGRYNQDFHYSYPLKAGGKLSVETFNGAIDLSAWDQNSVDISGTKYGPSQEAAAALRVDVDNNPDSVEVRVIRPTDFHGSRGARFTIRMPRTALLDHITSSNGAISVMGGSGPSRFRTSNGSIHVQAFEGNLDARTSNGSIELIDLAGEVLAHTSNARIRAENLKGPLDAGTSNGGITATLDQVSRPVRLETSNSGVDLTLPPNFSSGVRVTTSNGHITLHMPGQVNAQVVAHTNNASITSDFDVKVQGALNKNHLDGTIGAGGPLIELNTSNSPIRLLRM